MSAYIDETTIQALRGSCNLGVFFRLATTPVLCLWLGCGDIPAKMGNLDVDGTVYIGAGRLLNVPDVEVLINGLADSVSFSLSGLDPVTAGKINDGSSVTGLLCTLGIVPLDDRWQPLGNVIPLWTGTGDYLAEEGTIAQGETQISTRTITLVCISGDTTRARPDLLMWTAAGQRAISPGDAFCDRVSRYVQSYQVSWPRFALVPWLMLCAPLMLGLLLGFGFTWWRRRRRSIAASPPLPQPPALLIDGVALHAPEAVPVDDA